MPNRKQDIMKGSQAGSEDIAAVLAVPLLRNLGTTDPDEAVSVYRRVLAALRPVGEEGKPATPRWLPEKPDGW